MDSESPDLIKFNQHPDLLKQVAEQIIKDFGMFGLEIHFSGNPDLAYSELFGQVNTHFEALAKSNRQKFISILYRIDLSEAQIGKAIGEHPSDTFSAVVTDLVLKRELQKVVFRNRSKDL